MTTRPSPETEAVYYEVDGFMRAHEEITRNYSIEDWTVDQFLERVFYGWTVSTTVRSEGIVGYALRKDTMRTVYVFAENDGSEDPDDEDYGYPTTRTDRFSNGLNTGATGYSVPEMIDAMMADYELDGLTCTPSKAVLVGIEALVQDAPAEEQDALRVLNALRGIRPLSIE